MVALYKLLVVGLVGAGIATVIIFLVLVDGDVRESENSAGRLELSSRGDTSGQRESLPRAAVLKLLVDADAVIRSGVVQ